MIEGGFFLKLRERSRAALLPADREPQPQDARRQPRRALLHRAGPLGPQLPRHRQPRRRGLPLVHGRDRIRGGRLQHQTAGVLRHRDFDVAPDGTFEVFFGGEPRDSNWLALAEGRVGAHRALLLRGGRAGRGRRQPHRPAHDRDARARRPVAGLGRRRGGRGFPPCGATSSEPHAGAGEAGGAGAAVVGRRPRRTSSRRPNCPATSRSRPPTRRTRWRRTCSRRTRRW